MEVLVIYGVFIKKDILVDTIFNYRFHFDFRKLSFEKSGTYTLFGAGFAYAQKVCVEHLNKDMFLEVPNETCS